MPCADSSNVTRSHCGSAPGSHRITARVDPRRIADTGVAALLDRCDDAAMQVEVWEITSDIGVPAFFCVIDDVRGEPPFLGRFGGTGCHPSADVAMCRALAEAARAASPTSWEPAMTSRPQLRAGGLAAQHRRPDSRSTGGPSGGRPRPACAVLRHDTVAADVRPVMARLSARDFDRIARIDLTPGAVGLPCVRLVIPGPQGHVAQAGLSARQARRRRWPHGADRFRLPKHPLAPTWAAAQHIAFRPPARYGDITGAVRSNAAVIGLIDGVFDTGGSGLAQGNRVCARGRRERFRCRQHRCAARGRARTIRHDRDRRHLPAPIATARSRTTMRSPSSTGRRSLGSCR